VRWLLSSLSFRLALIYAGLFTASLLVLLAIYFWVAIRGPIEEVRDGIAQEGRRYAMLYNELAEDAFAATLEGRAASADERRGYHAFVAADGRIVTQTIPHWPPPTSDPWMRLKAGVDGNGPETGNETLVLDQVFSDGARLLLARDIDDLDEREQGIRNAAIWVIPAMVVLVIVGGLLMSHVIGRRLDAVGMAARRVMAGDLSERIPIQGTGDDFDRLGETLNLMLARIEASVESVRRVSDSVAHELRTPLARLQADLREIEAASLERRQEKVRDAIFEAELLASMFDAVLRISRIETKRHAAEMRQVDLAALLRDAAEYYQPAAEERELAFRTDLPDKLCIKGDPHLLFQAVSNLLDNAIKFTPAGGRVSLFAGTRGRRAVIIVADNGPGIPSGMEEMVTERFFRAPVDPEVPGFGLGLSLVTAVATLHRSILRFLPADPGLKVEWLLERD
jgi:signal transduction histidine kinase